MSTSSISLSSPAPSSATGSVAVTIPGQNGLVSFAGTVGMRVAVSITSTTLTSGTISILRPGGSVLKTGGLSKGAFLDVATLDTAGTHQIVFDPSDAGTGTVTFAVYNVPADVGSPTPIAITPQQSLTGGSGSAVITTPGQDAWFSFSRHRRPAHRATRSRARSSSPARSTSPTRPTSRSAPRSPSAPAAAGATRSRCPRRARTRSTPRRTA